MSNMPLTIGGIFGYIVGVYRVLDICPDTNSTSIRNAIHRSHRVPMDDVDLWDAID